MFAEMVGIKNSNAHWFGPREARDANTMQRDGATDD